MWHMKTDTWHLTRDTCHPTYDTWYVTDGGGWTFSQNVSFLALTIWDLLCCDDLEEKDYRINQLMKYYLAELFVEQPRLHVVC